MNTFWLILEYVYYFAVACIFVDLLYRVGVKMFDCIPVQTRFLWNLIRLTRSKLIDWEYISEFRNGKSGYRTSVDSRDTYIEWTYIHIYTNLESCDFDVTFCYRDGSMQFSTTAHHWLTIWLVHEITKSVKETRNARVSMALFSYFTKNIMKSYKDI